MTKRETQGRQILGWRLKGAAGGAALCVAVLLPAAADASDATPSQPPTTTALPGKTAVPIISTGPSNGPPLGTISPQSGIDPLTASNAELITHGLPVRPTDPTLMASWEAMITGTGHYISPTVSINYTHPGSTVGSALNSLSQPAATPETTCIGSEGHDNNPNWAGNAATDGPFDESFMEWEVPNLGDTTNNSYSSIWPAIGTGNSSNDQLVQAGTEQDDVGAIVNDYAWVQMYPQNTYQYEVDDFPISPDDKMGVSVSVTADSDGTAYWEILDYTTEQYTLFDETMVGVATGSQADYIVEDTTENGSILELANFGTEALADESFDYTGGTNGVPGDVPHLAYYMYGSAESPYNGELIASPGAFSNNCQNFSVTRENVY